MRRGNKWFLLLVMGLSFLTPIVDVDAAAVTITKTINEGAGIVPYADSIVKKYRVHNGQLQYRRWNETRGYWVDSEWINV
ncbi:hypothetical protein [Faecalicatena contorta]|uniref:Uncharacterized protein n=1 Tax=Faecalicatena contorta TaxID=39482 RepID=A0A315ZXY2_9FIRM|nr:hypothetical protein [Faecalicatena contorta]PWJ49768.1 hypothetical protein A8805_106178 [Faecalicatena contorta]SUQ14486.1 hypothetical protein SAMN05216529_106178 [Faecalicatena contorta]